MRRPATLSSRKPLRLLAVFLAFAAGDELAGQNVRGFVFDEDAGGPMEGVTVRLMSSDLQGEVGVTTTDVLGRFSFSVVGPRRLVAIAEFDGFVAPPAEVEVPALALAVVSVTIGMAPANPDGGASGSTAEVRTAYLRGRIVDAATWEGIEGATVGDSASGRSVVTRYDGRFELGELTPGLVRVRIDRLGYATESWAVEVEPGSDYEAVIPVSEQAIELAGISVTVRSRAVARRLLPIFERMERGLGGRFLTRADFERRGYPSVGASIQGLPSVAARQAGTRWVVRFRRGATVNSLEAGCDPEVWVDGIRAARSGEYAEDFFAMNTSEVEIIEIYPSSGSIPAEYGGGALCAIGIWTKRGR